MKRTENTYRMAQQLAQMRSVLMGKTRAQYDISPLRALLDASSLMELSPEIIKQFYESAVPLAGPLETPCLYWNGATDKSGYGIFYANGKQYAAHRLAFVLTQGPVPKGKHVLHACDTPQCIRWEHLSAGTHEENMAQKSGRGKAWNQHTLAIAKVPILPVVEYQEGEIVI